MSLVEKYELLDLIAENETRTYLARERASVRMVMVHQLLPGPNRISLLELVLRTRMIPSSPGRLQILELGEHGGIPYVVTEIIPGFQTLRQWLQEELAVAAKAPGPGVPPAQAGAWPAPTISEEPAPPAPHVAATPAASPVPTAPAGSPPPVAPPPRRDPGEFTQLFQVVMADIYKTPQPAPSAPAATPPASATQPEPPKTAPTPTPSIAPPPPEPGEFTRMFQQPAGAEATPKGGAQEPGEFTRMFQAGWQPSGPVTSEPQPPAAASAWPPSGPGGPPGTLEAPTLTAPTGPGPAPGVEGDEFAKLFEQIHVAPQPTPPAAPGPAPGVPSAGPQPLPSGPEPGEFTRMFQSPLAPSPLEPAPMGPAVGAPPGPIPPPPGAPSSGPWPSTPPAAFSGGGATGGEFTRIFGAPATAQPTQAPPPSFTGPSTGGATQFFAGLGTPTEPLPAPSATGPGEFTRIVASAPVEEPPIAAAPVVQTPQSAGRKATGSPYLPLFLILGFVFLVAVALILYFALRH